MKPNSKWRYFSILLILLCSSGIGETEAEENEEQEVPPIVSIVLLGRKGSGITSTVRQILGPKASIHVAEEAVASTDILEYTLRIPEGGKYNYLRLIDVPGLELGENLEHDAEIMSTLKSYLHEQGVPTLFLVVYRIDDKGIAGPNSNFKQLLRAIELLQRALFHTTTDNTLFLLTRLLLEPPEVQKEPQERIKLFRETVEGSTLLTPGEVDVVVGDNKPGAETPMENGFVKLPNKELYPKNVLEKLVSLAERSEAVGVDKKVALKQVLNYLVKQREVIDLHAKELVAHATDEEVFENDLEAFEYLLRQDNLDLPSNQVQNILRTTFEMQDAQTQISSSVQLQALQISLRNLNVEGIDDLPQTLSGLVHLFQQDQDGMMTSKYGLFYLNKAFNLEVPEYPGTLLVGKGYDLIHDRILMTTPFIKNWNLRPSSSLGYQFPDFVECEKLPDVEEVVLANTTDSLKSYNTQRLSYLSTPEKDTVPIDKLKGEPRPYLNYKYGETGRLVGLKEIRILECKMTVENDSIAIIDDGFISKVNTLPPVNTSDSFGLAQWKLFLHSHGTHIITKSFGGGCYQGLLTGTFAESAEETLQNIINFKNLNQDTRSLVYQFHVSEEMDPRASRIDELNESLRNTILQDWKRKLNNKFEMLENELELVPLSQVIAIANPQKQGDAEAATNLLLQGNLDNIDITRVEMSHKEKRKLAMVQGVLLQTQNRQKVMEKLKRFDEFADEAASKRE